MSSLFDNIFTAAEDAVAISPGIFFLSLLVSVALGIISSWIYSYRNVHSKQFIITLAVLPSLVAAVIFLVNGNLGTSVAVAGTFSLVRFRSAPAGSKELLGLFQAMATGLAVGTGYLGYAIALNFFFSLVILSLEKLKLGTVTGSTRQVVVEMPYQANYSVKEVDEFLIRNFKTHDLTSFSFVGKKKKMEMVYLVSMDTSLSEHQLIKECQTFSDGISVTITSEATKKNIL